MDDFNSVFRSAHPVFDVPGNPDGVDLLLTPAAVGTAPLLEDARANRDPVSEYVNDVMTIPASLAGLPALVFPFGSSREDGFPIGLQLVGQYGDDEFLLDAATVFERGVKGGTWK